ncbi:myosin-9 isoform X1 [Selaginella moellendorffii]|uniref:myosin-9 isoform X1 n=1 Tax=Selaginella moellendorffii TaxID=88036 RepID=UPI000D1CC34D|nr:myosin-9 isoform X1 [Selaginella moellendorffii]|eukprot:XP_024536914.1 myosin-9 isoform X1 [Selaginella moellendorffii]
MAVTLSSEMESYMEGSIAHMVGLSCADQQLREKLQLAERSQLDLQSQVHCLQERLREIQQKYNTAKVEASLSAQALKRQIAETQKVAEYCKHLSEECSRLENECLLYHNDRQIFMEAADDAEERAAAAEHRAADELREEFEQRRNRMEEERLVHDMVASAVNAAALRAVERERDAAVHKMRASERCVQGLFGEIQDLRKDAQQYEANLKKAEVEVEFLYQENNELKLLLGGKYPGSTGQAISPLHIQGIKCHAAKPGCTLLGLSSRQPLTPLRSNLAEWRRQYR